MCFRLILYGRRHQARGVSFCIAVSALEVSLATVLRQSVNVLPCLNIVQNQIRPQVEESPGRCVARHHVSEMWLAY